MPQPSDSHRVLVATDLPFWRATTGAEQRVASLAAAMRDDGFQVQTFYIGTELPDDQASVLRQQLDVRFYSSAQPPKSLFHRVKWWVSAVWNRFGLQQKQTTAELPRSVTLDDFRWPWAIKAFQTCIADFQPDSVLFEYVKMSYLTDGLSRAHRQQIRCLIDTHDVQHQRAEQFHQRGHAHWLAIDRETEVAALEKFDLIVAIQETEAATFRELVPDVPTVVCRHATTPANSEPNSNSASRSADLVVGYLGSANASNVDAICDFLLYGWLPQLQQPNCEPSLAKTRLVIGGTVCRSLQHAPDLATHFENGSLDTANISLLGRVDSLDDFYRCVDVIINPVQFGAGLKIKNEEAIAFGKPLITTAHGVLGMTPAVAEITVVTDTADAMMKQIGQWAADPDRLQQATQLASACQNSANHGKEVYRPLFEAMRN